MPIARCTAVTSFSAAGGTVVLQASRLGCRRLVTQTQDLLGTVQKPEFVELTRQD
jgi:hypothetical protein